MVNDNIYGIREHIGGVILLAILQRTKQSRVEVASEIIGAIDHGLLVFLGVEKGDGEKQVTRMVERVLGYRIFSDANDQMNLNVQDVEGGVLVVPQFTLAADTNKGMRPSFTPAALPGIAEKFYDDFVMQAKQHYTNIETGRFGADMQVHLCNDGPVTIILRA